MPANVILAKSRAGSAQELVKRLQEEAERLGVTAQTFDPEAIVSARQLLVAGYSAKKAFGEERATANTLANELLLHAAATRQVGEAIKRVGVKKAPEFVLFVEPGEKTGELLKSIGAKEAKGKIGGREEEIAKLYGVEKELLRDYPLEGLVLEKMSVAMLGK